MATQNNLSKTKRIVEQASLNQKGTLAEAIFQPTLDPPIQFATLQNGRVTIEQNVEIDKRVFGPPLDPNGMIEKGVVLLASNPSQYGSQQELLAAIEGFIHRYADVPEFWEPLIAHYILMTWVYDRFTAVPYLRFLGDWGTGKSRCLQVAGSLCYKAIFGGGSTTASPLFRLLEIYHGTFVADEADFKNSESWVEIVKIFNCGYMRGLPVLRSEKVGDSYEPRAYDVFGPKIIANRKRFEDQALESRCLTLEILERRVRKDVPRQLPPGFFDEARELRNRLLQWRFENLGRIKADESKLLHLEPRSAQIGTPLYSVSSDPRFRQELISFLERLGAEQRQLRPQAVVLEAIRQLWKDQQHGLTVGEVGEKARSIAPAFGEDFGQVSDKAIGQLIRSLGFVPEKTRDGYKFKPNAEKLAELTGRYGGTFEAAA